MIPTFLRLKWALLVNGLRRSARSPLGVVGMVAGGLTLLAISAVGVIAFLGLRDFWDPVARERVVMVGVATLILGWWILPLLTGGVDETVDPSRLMLLPLSRRDLRRGQIAAGLLGPAPLVGMSWCVALAIGMAGGPSGPLFAVVASASVLALALVGSRAIATTLALVSRSRRGADAASMLVALAAAALFSAAQLIRFVEPESLDPLIDAIRWTPPGWAADAMLAGRSGESFDAVIRLGGLWLCIGIAAAWWSEGLDRLLTDPGTRGSGRVGPNDEALPLFVGLRSRLPRTPAGASAARELVYLARQPGRRIGLFTGSALGLVYLVAIVAGGSSSSPLVVLGAPMAMLFSVQYASNQLGVDAESFWLEVVTAPPAAARWTGRWVLATLAVLLPVLIAGVATAWWSGGWKELGAMLTMTLLATPAVVTVGSLVSVYVAIPLPDSGNPFATRQSADARGCINGLVSLGFVAMIALLVLPGEFLLVWALPGRPLVAVATLSVAVLFNVVITRLAVRAATDTIVRRELDVLDLLDPQANR